jgi:hypothetical protein
MALDDFISGRTEDLHGHHLGYFYADVHINLRDLFAVFALIGLAANSSDAAATARDAYQYADSMLRERKTNDGLK